MFRSVLTLKADPGQAERILELYRQENILQQSLDLTRQIRSDIAIAADGSGVIVVTADWPDEDGYQEWLDHPQRANIAPGLNALLANAEVGTGQLFRIDDEVARG